ncbi:TBC1 domain family member 15 [Toxorhynchites rutilus septentrionalis]|uniref:TBC1 domain family member 15 n=1 Tax=Toxorhynchites rutilus septentrionalis TaxID=329112 RepID=UPI00247A4AE3|nr:TBC1 domain family member 15 [Toxorhynchites rutilus septentrionalis]
MDNDNSQEIFMQHGVTLKKVSASHILALNTVGVLSFCKHLKNDIHFFEWQQSAMCEITDTESQDSGWSLVDTIESTSSVPMSACADESKPSNSNSTAGASEKPRADSKISFRVLFRDLKGLEIGKNELRFYGPDYSTHSLYLFNHGSPQSFVDFLERKRFIKKSSRRKPFYHCLKESDNDKLQKSFSELNIEDIRNRPRPNPYIDFMSKLANVHHQILPLNRQPEEYRPRTSSKNETEDVTSHNGIVVVNEEEKNKLVPRPPVHRGPPLDAAKWAEFRSPSGSILNTDSVKEIIFKGGINNDIRAEVWKYLLELDFWDHTTAQRDERRGSKTQEYFQMKLQWLTITPTQEHNFTGYRERKCQIEKDVKRTDRTYEFFAGDDNPNLAKLQDILMTYVMYNFDLGYVQGMSDLLAPILCLVQNEAESFWCFVGFMQKVFSNFDIDQKGMKQQLEHLRTLLAFVNEKLYNYLKENQSENMYFCFRWLLVWFKREFSNDDIMHLWEVLWTNLPCPNFHLFICVAILDQEMDVFIDGQFTFTEILKHVNELSGNLNLIAILEQAESIYLQVKQSLELSKEPLSDLRRIIGEEVSPDEAGSAGSDEDDDSCMSIVNEKSSEEQELMQRKVDEACDLSLSYAFF